MIDQALMHANLHVDGVADGTLEVVEFKGTDTISNPYEFKILCASSDDSLSSRRMSRRPAKLSLSWMEWSNSYSGILFAFQKMQTVDKLTFYMATLSPNLRLLELTHHNQVFLKMSLPEILESVLKECSVQPYDIRFTGVYPKMEYVCQYNETHFNFISRWMEHSGVYYFFEETEHGEKLIITDSKIAHLPLSEQAFPYRQASGMDEGEKLRSIFVLTREERIVPKEIVLKDYNYQRPDIELLVTAEVDPEGMGRTYSYGDHFPTTAQGKVLAKIRAEELLCGKTIFHGQGGCLPFRSGRMYSLSGHPDNDFNASYLLTSVEHSGRMSSPLVSGVATGVQFKDNYGYRNVFAALPADGQFRPARVAVKTKIEGMINAVVDAEGSGQYAELDELGRYKVRLPFDLANKPAGHASHWLRMAQPYAGENYGMHFPLHKGTGVMLAFVNADPDRPFITSAVHNSEKANPIRGNNARLGGIKSAGNNQLVFNDTQGREGAALWSPFHDSGIAVGAVHKDGGGSLLQWTSGEGGTYVKGASLEVVGGTCTQAVAGATNYAYLGTLTNVAGPVVSNLNFGTAMTYNRGYALSWGAQESVDFSAEKELIGEKSVEIGAGLPEISEAMVKKAKRALGLTLTGVAVATAGSTLMSGALNDGGAWTDDGNWVGATPAGCTMAVAGGAVALGAAAYGTTVCKKMIMATKKARAANMRLDQNGVVVASRPTDGSLRNPEVLIVCGPKNMEWDKAHESDSYISISNAGETVLVANSNDRKILMDSTSESIKLSNKESSLAIDSDKIQITAGKFCIDNDASSDTLCITRDGKSNFTASSKGCILLSTDHQNKVAVTNVGVRIIAKQQLQLNNGNRTVLQANDEGLISLG